MKESIAEKIKATPLIGIINFNQTKRFYDDNFSTKENMFQFSLSKILIFIGEKNKILGIRSFYKNLKKEEKEGQIGYNDALKVINIIKFEIPSNDHLCCLYIFTSDKGIEQLKFLTKKGKELTVGEGGQNIIKNAYFIQNLMISLKQATGKRQALINILSESLYVSIFEFILFLNFSFFIFILNSKYPRV